ncbi:hypothetical protein B0J13DRAFT_189017 [Dactylonectria estremocensis]|uniref:Uncharacterized protein n=1 Tax=Dactylonectria estremocensis TaxID=1079267 RepID=A0A9P9JFA9_9HYPO|nr:hypothetical protein B0J13DRAFT_189017 [Dactylonectria estremocensis]
MDTVSTLSTITSSTSTALTSPSSQLTYTTAGTPYNPGSSQPLQPPTRRGRSLKWASGGAQGNLALLPKSFLATLPLKTGIGRTPSVHQYTPLQQNYDRAVTPFNDPDHLSANMSATVPSLRHGNTPPGLSSLFSELDQDKYVGGGESDGSDNESDFGTDPLMNMTVKSLHNLASYPNPTQKRAQKALLRGAKPASNGLSETILNRASSSPLSLSFCQPEILKKPAASPTTLRPTQSDPFGPRKVQDDVHLKTGFGRSSTVQLEASPLHEVARFGNLAKPMPTATSASMLAAPSMASGLGVPLPLTAGPPGQRQYRPSTFESTFKALQTNSKPQNGENDEDEEDMAVVSQHTLLQAGIDDLGFLSDSASSVYKLTEPSSPEPHPMATLKPMVSFTDDVFMGTSDQHGFAAYQGPRYHSRVALPNWIWPSEPLSTNWTPRPARMAGPWKPGTDRLTEEEVAVRHEKINRHWYAGADFLGKAMDDVVDEAHQRKMGTTFGAIGDGRPMKIKEQYGSINIAKANRMSVAEHAHPLLNMAFASVLRHVERSSCPSGLLQTDMAEETLGEQASGQAVGQAVEQGSLDNQSLFGKMVDGGQ